VAPYAATTLAGDSIRLEDYRGEYVLLYLWATWCGPCRPTLPVLETLHRELGGSGLRVIGINIDTGPPGDVQAFLDEQGLTFANAHDRKARLQKEFGWSNGVPQTLLLDPEGRIVKYSQGGYFISSKADAFYDSIRAIVHSE
jgi:thiol-disulfide isomerase/thioredoxin